MNDFYNAEYLSERVAALAQERDDLRRDVRRLIMDLDKVTAERDALRERLNGKG